MNDKKSKIITIAALIVAVIGLSIGFAAFASTLNITSGASVTPANDFYVKFADNVTGSGTFTNYTENNVFASNTSTGVGNPTGGVINNNNGTNPIISNLTASFTAPGQSVTYDFYVVNDSAYTAYLNKIEYMSGKTCTSDATSSNPATQSLVDNACSGITSTVEVGGTNTVPQTLGSKEYKTVKVTISYNGEYVDGAFKVTFGDIKLIFSTVETEEEEEETNPLVGKQFNEFGTDVVLLDFIDLTIVNAMSEPLDYVLNNNILTIPNFEMSWNVIELNNNILLSKPEKNSLLSSNGNVGCEKINGTYCNESSDCISFNDDNLINFLYNSDDGVYCLVNSTIYQRYGSTMELDGNSILYDGNTYTLQS